MSASSDYFSDNSEHFSDHEINEEETNEIDFEVLHPDNPLMIKFQDSLTELLQNKIKTYAEENRELERELKLLKNETEDLSEKLYNEKNVVSKLQKDIEKESETLSNLVALREREEEEFNHEKELYEKELAKYKENQKLNSELRTKVETQRNLLQQIRQLEEKQASSLAVMSRIMSKNKEENKKILNEKEKQDYLLMRLENEVFKLQMQIVEYKNQIKEASDEVTKLTEKLSQKENEFQTQCQDNDRLTKIWENLVNMVSKRDQKCAELKAELEKAKTRCTSHRAELRNYERNIEQEMLKNEFLLSIKNQRDSELRAVEKDIHDMTKEEKEKQQELAQLDEMIECTKKNLQHATEEELEQKRELEMLQKSIDKLSIDKFKLEDSLLTQIQEDMISNKELSRLYAEINEIREEIKQKEISLQEIQENYYNDHKLMQIKQNELGITEEYVDKMQSKIKTMEEESIKNERKLEHLNVEVQQANCSLDKKRKELQSLEEKPIYADLEEKMKLVQEDIEEISKKIEQKKKEYIRKQREVMLLTEKKTRQINEMNELRKENDILQQTVLRLEHEIFKAEQESKRLDKSIAYLFHQISKLNSEYSDVKHQKENLNKDNFVYQNEILGKLKDSEKETLVTVEEVENLEKEKKSLEEKLLQLQREDLEWQKKVELANEMKRNIMHDESEKGDIGAMRNEIHRMEIRYAQLKKAQNSLITDLKSCVSKRDNIIDKKTAKEKNKNSGAQAEQAMKRKIKLLESDIAALKKEVKTRQEKCAELEKERDRLQEECKNMELKIEELETTNKELDEQIQELTFQKQKDLAILSRKQKFANFLCAIKDGKIKGPTQSEDVIEKNYSKHQSLNADLQNVLETVINEYPHLKKEIIPILNLAQARSQ